MLYTLKNQLIERLNDNYSDFLRYLDSVSRSRLIEMAGRIAAVTDAHWYLTSQYEWDDEYEIAYLLLFQNPLSMITDAWEEYRDDELVDFDMAMFEVFENEDAFSEYTTISDAYSEILAGFVCPYITH